MPDAPNAFDHTVLDNQDFVKIALERYGNENAHLPLATYNQMAPDATLVAGTTIKLPQLICFRESIPEKHLVEIRSATVSLLPNAIPFFRSSPESPGHYSRMTKSTTDIADDMRFNDYSKDRYRHINPVCWSDPLLLLPDAALYAEMTTMCAGLFSGLHLLPTILRVVKKFYDNNSPAGLPIYNTIHDAYSDDALTKATLAHHSTKEFVDLAKSEAIKILRTNMLDPSKTVVRSLGRKPIFHDASDIALGLTILINDTWAYEVDLIEYRLLDSKRFEGKLKIKVFDHFGLDEPDLDIKLWEEGGDHKYHFKLKPYGLLAGFRAWFILQHIRGYRPFWTIFETTAEIEGSL